MAGNARELMIRIAGRVDPSLLRATSQAQQQVSGLGSSFGKIGKLAGMAMGGFAVGSAITDTINTYKDFDQAMAMTAATAGATGAEYEKLKEAAMSAGRGTTKTATEASQALGYLALAGYNVKDSTEALMPILKLSEATQMDLATCSDEVTDSMSAMGLTVQDLPGYLDVLCKANNKSNQTAQQLMEANIKCGGTMKGLGVSAADSATALGVLANRGIKGAEGGIALNAVVNNLTTGTGQAGEMMKKLGISAFDSSGKFIGLQATLMKVQEATAGMTEEERNAAFAAIGGKEHIKDLNALMSGLTTTTADGSTEWNALNKELKNADGSLDQMNAQVTNTLNGAMSRFGSALDDIKIRAGLAFGPALAVLIDNVSNNLMPAISTAVEKVGNELEYAANVINNNWGTIEPVIEGIGVAFATWKIAEFILGLPQAVAGINAMIGAQKALTLAKIADKIETIQIQALYWKDILLNARSSIAMGARTVATYAMATATGVWNGVCMIASGVTTAFGAALTFLTSPIGLVVLAIAGLIAIGVYLYNHWDEVKAKAIEIWGMIAEKLSGVVEVIKVIMGVLVSVLSAEWDVIVAGFNSFLESMKTAFGFFTDALGNIVDFVVNVFQGNWAGAWQSVVDCFGNIFGGLRAMATGPINAIIAMVNELITKINGVSFDIPSWVPGYGGKHIGFDIPSVPALASGGVTNGPTLAMIGEGSEQEAVMPLSKLNDMLNAKGSSNNTSQAVTYSPQFIIQGNASKAEIAEATKDAFEQFKSFMGKYERDNRRLRFSQ